MAIATSIASMRCADGETGSRAPQIPPMLAGMSAQAQRDGAINSGLAPCLLVSLMGLTLFPAASALVWRNLFRAGDIDADVLRAHTLALLECSLGAG
jgi:hypothetical protein